MAEHDERSWWRNDLRVSDSDRERYIALLRGHTTEGRLTLDEFSDRVGEVYAARTFSDLNQTLRELPVEQPARPRQPVVRRARSSLTSSPLVRKVAVVMLAIWIISMIAGMLPLFFIIGGVVCITRKSRHHAWRIAHAHRY